MIHHRSFREWLVIRAAELAEPGCDLCNGSGEWDAVEHCQGGLHDKDCVCGGTGFVVCLCVFDAIDEQMGTESRTMQRFKEEYDRQCAIEITRYHQYSHPQPSAL